MNWNPIWNQLFIRQNPDDLLEAYRDRRFVLTEVLFNPVFSSNG